MSVFYVGFIVMTLAPLNRKRVSQMIHNRTALGKLSLAPSSEHQLRRSSAEQTEPDEDCLPDA